MLKKKELLFHLLELLTPYNLFVFVVYLFIETGSHYVALVSLELATHAQPPRVLGLRVFSTTLVPALVF